MPRELTADDKMQVRGIGDLKHPGACASCGNGTCEEGYLDLGIYYDYEGYVYLCMTCIIQAAETVGMLSPGELNIVMLTAAKQAQENETLKVKLHDAEERLREYDTVIGNALKLNPGLSTSAADVFSRGAAKDANESEGAGDGSTEESVKPADANESESAESSKNKGRADVKFSSGNDGDLTL